MLKCTSGQLQERKKNGVNYYWIRLNLTDDTVRERKDRYQSKYIFTDLIVGGKTGRINNLNLANELLTQAIREYTPIGANMRFDKYVEYWLSEIFKRHDIQLTTKEAYSYKAKYIINYYKQHEITLAEVDLNSLQSFMNDLYEVKTSKGTTLQDTSVRDIMKVVKQIFSFAQKKGHLLKSDPCVYLKMPKVSKKEDDLPYISEDEIEIFKQALHDNCGGYLILEYAFLIGLFYGLRREEICGLKWSALRNGDIYIEHTISRVKTLVVKDITKTEASNRACALLPETKQIFDKIKQIQEYNKRQFGDCYKDSDYIFTWQDGRVFSTDYLSKKFKKIIQNSDSLDKRLHLHDLRVSCVSILVNRGINIKDVQKWVGHSNIQTTMNIYARTTRKRQYATGREMANVLFCR